jgi:2-polyprenyl-6-hydroxyphenyl methylase/3-demethylubiquinone-9 3-methyltransferase
MPVARELIGSGRLLLDVGCGDGAFAELVADRFDELHGVDFAGVALERARARGIRTTSVDLDKDSLPFGDGVFDHTVCLDVIEHVYDPVRLLKECFRVTASGGLLVVTTVNIRYLKYLLSLVVGGRFPQTSGDQTLYDGGHLHYFAQTNLIELLTSAGFVVERRTGVIGTPRLRGLQRWTGIAFVREFVSTGMAIAARRR